MIVYFNFFSLFFIQCGDTIFQLAYKDIVSVDVTKKKNEVAITFKRGDKYFWVICLKLKGIKGETPLSRHRKITVSLVIDIVCLIVVQHCAELVVYRMHAY